MPSLLRLLFFFLLVSLESDRSRGTGRREIPTRLNPLSGGSYHRTILSRMWGSTGIRMFATTFSIRAWRLVLAMEKFALKCSMRAGTSALTAKLSPDKFATGRVFHENTEIKHTAP